MDIEAQKILKRQRSVLRTVIGWSLAVSAIVFGAAAYVASDLKSVHGEVSARSLSEFVSDYMFVREGRRMKVIKNSKRAREVVRRATVAKAVKPGQEAKDDEELKLVWQMAYPFAGSNVALRIIQDYTGKSMATNYGDVLDSNSGWRDRVYDSEPIRKDMPDGPFKYRIDKDLPSSGNILVKTHCAGHCMFIVDEACRLMDTVGPATDVEEFFRGCATGTAFKRPNKLDVVYNKWAVEKALLLIRHPVEIIVSRFVNILEGYPPDGRIPYEMNHIGISQWCKVFNQMQVSKDLRNWYMDEGFQMIKSGGVLCHGELFRIAKFYSQALKVIDILDDESHVVRFEDYDEHLDGTIQGVMEFMEFRQLEKVRQIPFNRTGDNSEHYFSSEQSTKMIKFFNLHASEAAQDLFSSYV